MSEMVVQQLLARGGSDGVDPELVAVDPKGFEVAADWRTLGSPETYLGVRPEQRLRVAGARAVRRAAPLPRDVAARPQRVGAARARGRSRSTPPCSNEPGGRVAFRFQARDVNLVMGPATRGASIPFRVLLDGTAPGGDHGDDVDATATAPRRPAPVSADPAAGTRSATASFEIEFLDAGVEAYCFTFG